MFIHMEAEEAMPKEDGPLKQLLRHGKFAYEILTVPRALEMFGW